MLSCTRNPSERDLLQLCCIQDDCLPVSAALQPLKVKFGET